MSYFKILKFIRNWVLAWLDLAGALASILTFTLWKPWWSVTWLLWFDTKLIKWRQKHNV